MPVPGPKPKPTELKILEGNPGRRPLNDQAPKPQPVAPPMPRGLPKGARKFWRDHAPKLESLGILTEVDGPAFTMLALSYNYGVEAAKAISAEGMTIRDDRGNPRKHPLFTVFSQASKDFRALAAEFGLTPSARSRLKIEDPVIDHDDEFDF